MVGEPTVEKLRFCMVCVIAEQQELKSMLETQEPSSHRYICDRFLPDGD